MPRQWQATVLEETDLHPGKVYPLPSDMLELWRNGHCVVTYESPRHCLPCPYKHPLKSMTYGVYRANEPRTP